MLLQRVLSYNTCAAGTLLQRMCNGYSLTTYVQRVLSYNACALNTYPHMTPAIQRLRISRVPQYRACALHAYPLMTPAIQRLRISRVHYGLEQTRIET